MKTIILAAGQGTRLRPITDDRPKCLVELMGKSLLERQAEVIAEAELSAPIVVTGYLGEKIASLGFECRRNERFMTTNMVESLFCAEDVLNQGESVIILYGDIVYERRLLDSLKKADAPISLVIDSEWERYWRLRMDDPLEDAESLKMNSSGFITELGKKAASIEEIQGQYVGMIKFRADVIPAIVRFYHGLDRNADYDGQEFPKMYMTSFLQALIDSGIEAKAVEVENGWLEVDSVEDLEVYEKLASTGELSRFYEP